MAERTQEDGSGQEREETMTSAESWFRSVSQMASRVSKVDYNDVLETCLKDLVEFRPAAHDESVREGEAKEDVAGRSGSENEAGTSEVARASSQVHESFDTVGKSLEDIGKTVYSSTRLFFGQIKQAVEDDLRSDPDRGELQPPPEPKEGVESSSRTAAEEEFEQRVEAMQRDSATYCDEPEDEEDFQEWLKTFNLEERKGEVEDILRNNSFMNELQSRIVPLVVEYDEFWTHYFYKLQKLKEEFENITGEGAAKPEEPIHSPASPTPEAGGELDGEQVEP